MGIGSFSARLMRNTSIKVTLEHYGRIAMLVSQYACSLCAVTNHSFRAASIFYGSHDRMV
jgi:hypothetical protein